jgi:hypothetical protein
LSVCFCLFVFVCLFVCLSVCLFLCFSFSLCFIVTVCIYLAVSLTIILLLRFFLCLIKLCLSSRLFSHLCLFVFSLSLLFKFVDLGFLDSYLAMDYKNIVSPIFWFVYLGSIVMLLSDVLRLFFSFNSENVSVCLSLTRHYPLAHLPFSFIFVSVFLLLQ